MKRTLMVITSGLAVAGASLAQMPPDMAPLQTIAQSLLQQVDTLTAGAGGGVVMRTLGAAPETGKPYSATVTTQTRQTYLDGTQVNHSTTTLQYRDADGRVGTETESAGRGGGEPVRHIVITRSCRQVQLPPRPGDKDRNQDDDGGRSAASVAAAVEAE